MPTPSILVLPRQVNNNWTVGLTKAEVSPSVFTPLSPSVFTPHQILYSPSLTLSDHASYEHRDFMVSFWFLASLFVIAWEEIRWCARWTKFRICWRMCLTTVFFGIHVGLLGVANLWGLKLTLQKIILVKCCLCNVMLMYSRIIWFMEFPLITNETGQSDPIYQAPFWIIDNE